MDKQANELKKLEKIGVREISKATHIQEELLEAILEKNYEKLLDCNTAGFIKILERDYGVDLSGWLEEFNKIKSEIKVTKTTIDRQLSMPNLNNHKKPNYKIWSLIILLLVALIVYFKFYDLIKKPVDEFLEEKKVDYTATPTINKAEENLVSVGVEVPKFDENDTLVVPGKLFVNLDQNETNATFPNALDLSIKKQNEANLTENNATKFDENLTASDEVFLIPTSKIWVGSIDLTTGKKANFVTDKKISFDFNKNWLIMTGHGYFDLDSGANKQQIREKSVMRILIKDKKISFISSDEFIRLNGGKSW